MRVIPGYLQPAKPDAAASPLVAYALDGLRRCWMPEHGRYSCRYVFDGAHPGNQSVPASDIFYTLNVLLGLSQLAGAGGGAVADVETTYRQCCRGLAAPGLKPYAYGMALWAGAALGIEPPGPLIDRAVAIIADRHHLTTLSAQDIGMLACGCVALAAREGAPWRGLANRLVEHLRDCQHPRTQLFLNSGAGWRLSFSSFASQVYSLLALYQFGEATGADWAIRLANGAAARVIASQGGRGEWPWFYCVPGGRVADFYEVYSVHQYGMAPAFLQHAARHGVPDAGAALVRGFEWLFGDNEMGVSMLRPAESMFYRSQRRCYEDGWPWRRAVRSLTNALLARADAPPRHRRLMLRRECRSYELGWILWSFGGRADYPELTDRPEFAAGPIAVAAPCPDRAGRAN